MRKTKIIAIVLALGFILTSCNMVEVNPERDRQTVVADVEGQLILKGEALDIAEYQISMYQAYGLYPEDFTTNLQYKEDYEDILKSSLDIAVDAKLEEVIAKQKGCYEFTAEEREALDDQIHDIMNSYLSTYGTILKAKPEYANMTEEELGVIAYDTLDEYFADLGYEITKQDIIDDAEASKAKEILRELTTKSIEVTEDEVKAEYDRLVEEAKTGYDNADSNFEQDATSGSQIYYYPENARKAQHILIKISDEDQAAIDALKEAGDEDGALALEDEAMAKAKEQADAAYQRAIAGEDFKLLMDELGQDPGMDNNEYYIVANPTSIYATEFADGLYSLEKVGDISEPVKSAFGYHIIKYFGDVESGPVAYDDVHDDIYDTLLQSRQDAEYQKQFDIWREEANIKFYYRRLLN
ncbi:MAG: peptidylprolyl isomerase [Eubacteriales bacterium]